MGGDLWSFSRRSEGASVVRSAAPRWSEEMTLVTAGASLRGAKAGDVGEQAVHSCGERAATEAMELHFGVRGHRMWETAQTSDE